MIDIEKWMKSYVAAVQNAFGSRVRFIGLQGSYGRGEATDTSDIDVVCILDRLAMGDLAAYDAAVSTLPHRELLCGFVSGWEELMHWQCADLFSFYYDTKPIYGDIHQLLERLDEGAIRRSIHISACNLYHMCVHNILHEKSPEILQGLYKEAAFVIRAICFTRTGKYYRIKSDLLCAASLQEGEILSIGDSLKKGASVDFLQCSQRMLEWSSALILQYA